MVELVEADIEIGFQLVDMLEVWPAESARLMSDVEDVYADVQRRVLGLPPEERKNFEPLIGELRRAIDLAKAEPPAAD